MMGARSGPRSQDGSRCPVALHPTPTAEGDPIRATPVLRLRGRALVAFGAAALPAVLAGCSGAVEVAAAPGAGDPACTAVAAAWPREVAGLERGAAAGSPAGVAVWGEGDGAVIARCGVATPPPTTADCLDVDGVDWVVRRLDDGAAFTTYGRTPALEVLVPKAYAPEPLVMSAFAPAGKAVPQGARRCS